MELPNGGIALRRTDDANHPLVTIHFSDEARLYLGESVVDIGKVMIGAGVQMVGQMNSESQDPVQSEASRLLH